MTEKASLLQRVVHQTQPQTAYPELPCVEYVGLVLLHAGVPVLDSERRVVMQQEVSVDGLRWALNHPRDTRRWFRDPAEALKYRGMPGFRYTPPVEPVPVVVVRDSPPATTEGVGRDQIAEIPVESEPVAAPEPPEPAPAPVRKKAKRSKK